jgi:AcrR family transcriptional regulator
LDSNTNDTPLRIISVAERLFAQIGFQKATVGDIARELRVSPSNIYRFYASKSDINESVAAKLLSDMVDSVAIAVKDSKSASDKLRIFMAALEQANADRFLANRKLHELLETAFNENWPIVQDHIERLTRSLAEIISEGDRDGEFNVSDCGLAAVLVRSACMRFWHPRLMVEFAQDLEPLVDLMIDFCLAAFAHGVLARDRAPAKPLKRPSPRRFPLLN